ncbi:MAG TPA: hypothetical protein VHW09_27680 [Bryobacteraceae bacterium]|nr:hypothetical protein [Bryobacteraceae bacterium]
MSSPDFMRTVYLMPSGVPLSGAGAVTNAVLTTMLPSGRMTDSLAAGRATGADGSGCVGVVTAADSVGFGWTGVRLTATVGLGAGAGAAVLGAGLAGWAGSDEAE